MLTYYPAIKPNEIVKLTVEAPHEIHVEECGDPDGLPVLFVHGGPGAGCDEYAKRFFDPQKYRIILFDQRGCGKSTPHAELENNHTEALLADMETIREHFNIKKWILFGGSWGSTLSLVYAQTFPENVMGLILRGIFLGRPQDIAWFYQRSTRHVFPDYWQDFVKPLAANERDDIIGSYYKLLTSDDEIHRMAAAKAWSTWEARCATLVPQPKVVEKLSDPIFARSFARLECHYFHNDCFLKKNQILEHADRLKNIPGIITHGRYDMICPLENAWSLHQAWPKSTLNIIRQAGHSANEPATVDALVHATQEMAKIFRD